MIQLNYSAGQWMATCRNPQNMALRPLEKNKVKSVVPSVNARVMERRGQRTLHVSERLMLLVRRRPSRRGGRGWGELQVRAKAAVDTVGKPVGRRV